MGQGNPIENQKKFTELIQKADEVGKKLYEANKTTGMLSWADVKKLASNGKPYAPYIMLIAKNPSLEKMYQEAYEYAPDNVKKSWEKLKTQEVVKYATERSKPEEKPVVVTKDTTKKKEDKKKDKKDTTSKTEKPKPKETYNKTSHKSSSRFILGAGGGGFGVSPLFYGVHAGYFRMGNGETFTQGWGAYLQGFKPFGDPYRAGSFVVNISPVYRIGIGDIGSHLAIEVGPSASVLLVTNPSRMAPDLITKYRGPAWWSFGGIFGLVYSGTFEKLSRVSPYIAGYELGFHFYFGPNTLYPLGSYFQTNKFLSGVKIGLSIYFQPKQLQEKK